MLPLLWRHTHTHTHTHNYVTLTQTHTHTLQQRIGRQLLHHLFAFFKLGRNYFSPCSVCVWVCVSVCVCVCVCECQHHPPPPHTHTHPRLPSVGTVQPACPNLLQVDISKANKSVCLSADFTVRWEREHTHTHTHTHTSHTHHTHTSPPSDPWEHPS